MTTDAFTDAARAEAERRWSQGLLEDGSLPGHRWMDRRIGFEIGALWARTYPAAQEPTDDEVEAAARAIHINTIREFDDLGGLDQHALRTRARKALVAARAARRDEEERDD